MSFVHDGCGGKITSDGVKDNLFSVRMGIAKAPA
jgi:hypothetical protein